MTYPESIYRKNAFKPEVASCYPTACGVRPTACGHLADTDITKQGHFYVYGTALSTLHVLTCLILISILGDRYYYYPCCTDKETATEQLRNLPKVTQLRDRARIQTQEYWLQSLLYCHLLCL